MDILLYVRKVSSILFEKLRKSEFLFGTSISSYIKEIALCFNQLINEKIHAFIDLMNSDQYQSILDETGNDLKLK